MEEAYILGVVLCETVLQIIFCEMGIFDPHNYIRSKLTQPISFLNNIGYMELTESLCETSLCLCIVEEIVIHLYTVWTHDLFMPYRLIGACESCPSSTTTMQMGIERVLKEKFGDAIKDICQVYDEQIKETTVEVSLCMCCLYDFPQLGELHFSLCECVNHYFCNFIVYTKIITI